jgi:hypothetical protein
VKPAFGPERHASSAERRGVSEGERSAAAALRPARWAASACFVGGALGVVLGFRGFLAGDPAAGTSLPAHVADSLWKSLALLVLQIPVDETSTATLRLARLLAPLATIAAFAVLCHELVAARWGRWRLSRLRGHTILAGLGYRGRGFLSSVAAAVVLDPEDHLDSGPAAGSSAPCVRGDARAASALRLAGVERAARALVLTGSDALNLEVLAAIGECRAEVKEPFTVALLVRDPALLRALERDDGFVRRERHDSGRPATGRRGRVEVFPFSVDRLAVRHLLLRQPVFDLAALGVAGRLHLVVVGWSAFALELLEQLARLPFRDFAIPRVDLVCDDPAAALRELGSQQPAFLAGARLGRQPEAGRAADDSEARVEPGLPLVEIHLHAAAPRAPLPDRSLFAAVEPGELPTVTAVVVSLGADERTVAGALELRRLSRSEGRWRAPIYAHLERDGPLVDLLRGHEGSPDPSERVVPFGMPSQVCRLEEIFGEREAMARALHEAYRETVRVAHAGPGGSSAADVPWERLHQTYRQANRRAVDHLPVKLASAGYRVTGERLVASSREPLASRPDELESLARLEHRSWEIDRLLDGWRAGSRRDEARRVHEAIGVSYEELDERLGRPLRAFDREQVALLARLIQGGRDVVTARRELCVGVVGHNLVSPARRDEIAAAAVAATLDLVRAHAGRFVTVVTPLAPGADAILAGAVGQALAEAGVPHRLVVVRAVPAEVVLHEGAAAIERGGVWSLDATPAESGSAVDLDTVRRALTRVVGSFPEAVVVDLTPLATTLDSWDREQRHAGFRRANAYLLSRCHVLLAHVEADRPSAPGGTVEVVSWAKDPGRIPQPLRQQIDDRQLRAVRVVSLP